MVVKSALDGVEIERPVNEFRIEGKAVCCGTVIGSEGGGYFEREFCVAMIGGEVKLKLKRHVTDPPIIEKDIVSFTGRLSGQADKINCSLNVDLIVDDVQVVSDGILLHKIVPPEPVLAPPVSRPAIQARTPVAIRDRPVPPPAIMPSMTVDEYKHQKVDKPEPIMPGTIFSG